MNITVDLNDLNSLYSNCCIPFSQLLYSSFYTKIIISKSLNIEEISLITKSISVSTCRNYPSVVLRDPKTVSIDVEYKIQHSILL